MGGGACRSNPIIGSLGVVVHIRCCSYSRSTIRQVSIETTLEVKFSLTSIYNNFHERGETAKSFQIRGTRPDYGLESRAENPWCGGLPEDSLCPYAFCN